MPSVRTRPFLAGFAALSLVAATTCIPKRAEAVASFFISPVPVAVVIGVVGGGMAIGGGTLAIAACTTGTTGIVAQLVCGLYGGTGIIAAIAGVIMLDAHDGTPGSSTLAFSPIEPDSARTLGVSAAQADSYNHELPEINAIRETIQSELALRMQRGDRVTLDDVQALWQSYRQGISPDSYAVVEAISASAAGNRSG